MLAQNLEQRGRTRTNCSCVQSQSALSGSWAWTVSPVYDLALEKANRKANWQEGQWQFLGSHTHLLRMDFKLISQSISQLITSVISSLEPEPSQEQDSNYTVWHICMMWSDFFGQHFQRIYYLRPVCFFQNGCSKLKNKNALFKETWLKTVFSKDKII